MNFHIPSYYIDYDPQMDRNYYVYTFQTLKLTKPALYIALQS